MTKIVQTENRILRETARPVSPEEIGGKKLSRILGDMREALAEEPDGVALAAPQIGVPLRLFIVSKKIFTEDEPARDKDLIFINPQIIKLSRKKSFVDEGCLSVRWQYGEVKRADKAAIEAWDETGQKFSWSASGLMAQIFQHETEHLDGILFTDKAKNVREIPPPNNQE